MEDVDVVLAAVKNNILALEFASNALKADKYFIIEAIKKNANSFKYASIN